jgi:hypothetical protein
VVGSGALKLCRARPLLVLCLLTLAVRVAMFLCPGADLSEGGRVMAEEMARGNTAIEIVRGPLLPLHEYQQPFWGGHIVIAAIAAPLFALFGSSLFVLRLATLPFALLGTLSAFLVLDRLAGRKAAWIGGLLLALPPPGYLLLSCTAQGTHLEASAINLCLVLLWLRERERPTPARILTLGFGLGFGVWFGFLALVPIALVLTGDALADRAFVLKRAFWMRVAGFVVGALPWIHLNWIEGGSGFDVYNDKLVSWFDPSGAVFRVARKVVDLAEGDLALSLWLPGSSEGSVGAPAILITLLVLLLWSLAAWRARHDLRHAFAGLRTPHVLSTAELGALALLLVPLYLAAYLGSRFELGPRSWLQNLRYLMPLWPLLFIGVAFELSRWRAWRGATLLAALLVAFGAGAAARADTRVFGRDLDVPAVSTRGLARMVAWSQRTDRETLLNAVARLDGWPIAERQEFLFSLGKWFRYWSAETTKLGPKNSASRPASNEMREVLRQHVLPEERIFFEAPAEDENVQLGEDLAAFLHRKSTTPPK